MALLQLTFHFLSFLIVSFPFLLFSSLFFSLFSLPPNNRKENANTPTPCFFREQPSTLHDTITPKVTSTDPRQISSGGAHGLSGAEKARFLKIREDLERSKALLPVQKYNMAKTRAMEYGWSAAAPAANTLSLRRNNRDYSHPRRSSEITSFAANYSRVQGVNPFATDAHSKRQNR